MMSDRPLERVLGQLRLTAGLLLLGMMLVIALVVVIPFIVLGSASQRRRRARALIHGLFRRYFRILAAWGLVYADLDELAPLRHQGAMLVVANHPSLLDAILILSCLPDASCVMKASLMSNPLLGVGARLAGYIRNDSPRALVRDAIRDLELGSQLVLFPEGTRTVQAPINRLTGSFATIAARAGAPIQLVVIETDSRFLSKGWPIWRRPRFPLHYRVRLIDRLSPQASREQIIEQTEQAFRRALLGETMPTPDPVPEV